MRTILLLAIFSVTLLLAECDPAILEQFAQSAQVATHTEDTMPDPQRIEQGRQIYLAQYCGTCHQLDAANTRGTFGPEHNQAALHAEQWISDPRYSGSATTTEDYLRESILEPQVFYTPGYEATSHHMPSYAHLPDDDIEALVYLLSHQREE